MISIAIFTFQRQKMLKRCLASLSVEEVTDILIFNDDESNPLAKEGLELSYKMSELVQIYNPGDFGFKGRAFRKPIYLNKAIQMAKSDKILFSDDDGIFAKDAVLKHLYALDKHVFCAGSIIRDRLLNRQSKSILQGTNYSFQRDFLNTIGGYDENYVQSEGGGDVDFWYRIYNAAQEKGLPTAYINSASQKVMARSKRKKGYRNIDPREYTLKKHDLELDGPMYKWFPEIRKKSNWMNIIDE
jgi:GT2 family glycosyltransferase